MNPVSSTSQLSTLARSFGSSSSCLQGVTSVKVVEEFIGDPTKTPRITLIIQKEDVAKLEFLEMLCTQWQPLFQNKKLPICCCPVLSKMYTVQMYTSSCAQLYWPQLNTSCHPASDEQRNDPAPMVHTFFRYCNHCSLIHACFFPHCFFKLHKKVKSF